MVRPQYHPIRFGLTIQPENASWDEMLEVWKLADSLGYYSAFTSDHMLSVLNSDSITKPCMDGWTVLAGMASVTKNVKLGVMVSGVTYRHPSVLAKIATTIDHISNGRLILGIGAAWNQAEHIAYGIPFPPNAERLHRLTEAVQIVKALWTNDCTTFEGKFYNLLEAPFSPGPIQQPRPPIWVGGWGERLTLKVVAREADGWNTTGSPSSLIGKVEALRRHCDVVGRDLGTIEKSILHLKIVMTKDKRKGIAQIEEHARRTGRGGQDPLGQYLVGGPADMQEQINQFIELGFNHFVPLVSPPYDFDTIQRFAEEVIPEFA